LLEHEAAAWEVAAVANDAPASHKLVHSSVDPIIAATDLRATRPALGADFIEGTLVSGRL